MSKHLVLDMKFNADVSAAKQQIQQLQSSLTQLSAAGSIGIGGEKITTELKQAGQAAQQLQLHLTKALNTETGKLDLNKLNNSLLGAKTNLTELATKIMAVGPQGSQAFMQLATSISQANAPAVTLNNTFSKLWITMKNTVKWQLSSSMIHGFVGAISSAYHYAQDLNKSLNNIRIVTGLSVAEMDKFAEKANKAAKALSVSTLDYTEAALIYFQQGLKGKEVEERAQVTAKLANVSRQTAEVTSNQLTAIWSNFDDGTKSLEYYADVLTALGAKTASSTDEIAGGLEKFAAIGETIGLSYEYAASALATITANTRQSEEVVGTALKTIFARIQGLKLGETLDDGTSLNKYSEALQSIGVSIFDQSGELKDMDKILNEISAKWENLSKAQQTALSQTVAGVRQYTQFVALMDNWDDGTSDSMVNNLETANNSFGTLNEQADKYAEGWEAARDRVRASAEAIYKALLDDEFFIGLNNMFSGILDGIGSFIDGIGGLKGVMGIAITFITSSLASKLSPAIERIRANFQVMFTSASTQANKLSEDMRVLAVKAQENTGINTSKSAEVALTNANQLIVAKQKLSSVNKSLSAEERMLAEMSVSLIENEQQKAQAIAATIDKLKEESAVLKEEMMSEQNAADMSTRMMSPVDRRFEALENQKIQAVSNGDSSQITMINNELAALNSQYEKIDFSATSAAKAISQAFVTNLQSGTSEMTTGNTVLKEYIANLSQFANNNVSKMTNPESLRNARVVVTEYINTLPEAVTKTEEFQKALTELGRARTGDTTKQAILNLVQAMDKAKFSTQDLRKMLIQMGQGANVKKIETNIKSLDREEKKLLKTQQRINEAIKNFNPTHKFTKVEKITAFGSALMSVSMIWNSFKSAVQSWKDPDISFGEKILSTFMAVGMAIPMVVSGFNNIIKMLGIANVEQLKYNLTLFSTIAAQSLEVAALSATENAKIREIALQGISQGLSDEEIVQSMMKVNSHLTEAQALAVLDGVREKHNALIALETSANNGNIISKGLLNLMNAAGITIESGGLVVREGSIAATIAQTVANWGLNASMVPVLTIILLITAALAAIIAIIWLVVSAVNALIDAYNADQIAAENAAKYAEVMEEKYKRLTEEANKFREAVTGYDEAVKSLQDLQYGTEEYKKALEEANAKAMELIETHGLWDQFERKGDLIVFKEGALEKAQADMDTKASEAKSDTYAAKILNNQAQNKNKETNMQRDIGSKFKYTYEDAKGNSQTGYRQISDEEVQELVSKINESGFDFKNSSDAEFLEWLKKPVDSTGKSMGEFSKVLKDNINVIAQNKDVILSHSDSVGQAALANQLYAEEIMKIQLSDTPEEVGRMMTAANGDQQVYNQILNAKTKALTKDVKVDGKTLDQAISGIKVDEDDFSNADLEEYGYEDMDDEKTARAYARDILGYSQEEVDAMTYDGGTGIGSLKTITGDVILDEADDDYMRANLAKWSKSNEIEEEFDKAAQERSKAIDSAMGKFADGGNIGKAIIASLENGVGNESYDQLYGEISSAAERDELKNLNSTELLQKFNLSEEEIKALGYSSAKAFEEAFDEGLAGWTPEIYERIQRAEAEAMMDQAAEAYELDAEVLKKQAQLIEDNTAGLEGNAKAAAQMAISNQRLNKGVTSLADNWSDWKKTLNGTNKTTQDYAKALVGLEGALKEVLNLSEDFVIPKGFLELQENQDLFDQIAKGSEEAVSKLGFNLAKAQVESAELTDEIADNMRAAFDPRALSAMANNGPGENGIENMFFSIKEKALEAVNGIQEAFNGLDPGSVLKGDKAEEFAKSLNDYALATGMSVEQMQSMLNSMQVQADVTTTGKTVQSKIPLVEKTRKIISGDEDSEEMTWTETARTIGYETVNEEMQIAQINTDDPVKFTKIDSGTISPSATSGSGGGSGGSKNTPQKKAPIKAKKASEEIERYHEINQAIEQQTRTLDRLSAAKDRAYGANRIKAIDKEIQALQKLNKLENQHLDEIQYNLVHDQQAAAAYGVTFDANGLINNYDEIMQQRMNQWKAEQDAIQAEEEEYEKKKNESEDYDADGAIKLEIDQKKEKSDEDYENFKETISQYEETMTLFEETIASIQDRFNEIAELTISKINEQAQQQLDFNNDEMSMLELRISILGESYSKFSEVVGIAAEKIDMLENSIKIQGNSLGQFTAQYQEGAITLDRFVKQIEEQVPTFISNIQALLEFDAEMMAYYEEAFNKAEEEFSKYFTLIDNGIEKLEHYKTMLSLIGKENDKNMLNTVLQAQYKTANDRLQASTNWYETAKKEYDILYAKWKRNAELPDDSVDKLSEKELEGLESRLEIALTKMNEADEQRLSDLEATGQIAQEILQNNLDLAREKFEKALVGSSIEDYMTELDRLSKKQEEYLTTTNKMYETNKLIREAQLSMDKTENKQAKQKYNDYIKYIGQLQESGKLSQYELSIAQAKYELLQAQIALEEAQEAKNQVRLTRDAEGNYGYVYTANEEKVSNAEQGVADAENKLYNIGLDGAKDYQSKRAEVLQEATETFTAIEEQYQTGQIASEQEYEQKMAEAKEYYYGLLEEYDRLYYLSLEVMQEESYDNTVDYELHSTDVYETFKNHVDGYLAEVRQSFDDYGEKVQNIKDVVDPAMGGLASVTEEVTEKTGLLKEATYELAQEAHDSLQHIGYLTEKWEKNRDEVYKNIEANYKYIESLREIQKFQLGQVNDYSEYLKGLVENGRGYDDRLVQEVLSARWNKMGGNDTYDYRQQQIDYVQKYAEANGLTLEEAEKYLANNDAWYKTLEMMRNYKIERTDWSAKKATAISNGASEESVKWMDDMRNEKLDMDWTSKIQQYIDWHKSEGITTDDRQLKEMLNARQAQIDTGKLGENPLSNEALLEGFVNAGYLIDTSKITQAMPVDDATFATYVSEIRDNKFGETRDAQREALTKLKVLTPSDIEDMLTVVWDNNEAAMERHGMKKDTGTKDTGTKDTGTKDTGVADNDKDKKGDDIDYLALEHKNSTQQEFDGVYGPGAYEYFYDNGNLDGFNSYNQSNQITEKYVNSAFHKNDQVKVAGRGYRVGEGGPEWITKEASPNQKLTHEVNGWASDTKVYTIQEVRPVTHWDGTVTNWYRLTDYTTDDDKKDRAYWIIGHNLKMHKEAPFSYDTGGYTGAWGPEGKIAMLHEKEIVLNKHDTENFLTATNILREISGMLDQNALVASLGAINLRAMTLNSPADQVLQQEVTIHADFPNVTEHNEIEIAIDNLINAASQHAYKA